MNPQVKKAIAAIADDGVDHHRVPRRDLRRGHRRAGSPEPRSPRPRSPRSPAKTHRQLPGRLVVRRIPDLNPRASDRPGPTVRHLAVPRLLHHHRPRRPGHRGRRQDPPRPRHHRTGRIADLKNSALAHLPSGKFTANAAWLVLAVIAFNLTRAAAAIAGPHLAKTTTATIRRKLIAVPARIASSARRSPCTCPGWPWDRVDPALQLRQRPASRLHALTTQPARRDRKPARNTLTARSGTHPCPHPKRQRLNGHRRSPKAIGGSGLSQ